jgi:hypothetical protein
MVVVVVLVLVRLMGTYFGLERRTFMDLYGYLSMQASLFCFADWLLSSLLIVPRSADSLALG